ncbi:hypothetical protein BH10CYA1_BH10CYA1_32540 [soil metagenome]
MVVIILIATMLFFNQWLYARSLVGGVTFNNSSSSTNHQKKLPSQAPYTVPF